MQLEFSEKYQPQRETVDGSSESGDGGKMHVPCCAREDEDFEI